MYMMSYSRDHTDEIPHRLKAHLADLNFQLGRAMFFFNIIQRESTYLNLLLSCRPTVDGPTVDVHHRLQSTSMQGRPCLKRQAFLCYTTLVWMNVITEDKARLEAFLQISCKVRSDARKRLRLC